MIDKDQFRTALGTTGRLRMNSQPVQMRKEFLHPGQTCVSSEPCTVTTIVGSCVAVCLWDPILHVGGVTHYILAKWEGAGQASSRYGDVAIEMLVNKMTELGGYRQRMQAHLFGGACMFDSFREREHHLGVMNVEIAVEALGKYGIKILTQQVGGRKGRKIVFQTSDGTFTVKEI